MLSEGDTFQLILESYDAASSDTTALETVNISINIIAVTYTRVTAAPTGITIVSGYSNTATIENIVAESITSDTGLDMQMVQSTSLSWVTLADDGDGNTVLTIEADGLSTQDYSLTLQSFDFVYGDANNINGAPVR